MFCHLIARFWDVDNNMVFVRVLIEMINAIGIEQRGPAFDAVHFISFFQKKFGEICTVLPGYPGNQSFFHFVISTCWGLSLHYIKNRPA